MEVIAAADSDERGQALINVVQVLRKVVAFIYSFTGNNRALPDTNTCNNSTPPNTPTVDQYSSSVIDSNIITKTMPPINSEEILKKVNKKRILFFS